MNWIDIEKTRNKMIVWKHSSSGDDIIKSKGPVKLLEWVKIALLFFHVNVKTVSVYDFKIVCVVLHPYVKYFSKRFTNKSKITMSCS